MVKTSVLATTAVLILGGFPTVAAEPPAATSGAATLGELEVRSTNDEGYSAARLNELATQINRNTGTDSSQPGADSPIRIPNDIHVFESGGRPAVGTKLD